MKAKLKKEMLIKFEELYEKLNKLSFIATKPNQTKIKDLPLLGTIKIEMESGSMLCLFYDFDRAIACLEVNNAYYEIED